jgi:hypothetical protein
VSGADCDTDHCLVFAKHRKRLAVRKQASQKCDVERLNLRKLNELGARKKYQRESRSVRIEAAETMV